MEVERTRSWPWVLWYLWKNRNSFLFEGKEFAAEEILQKAKEETDSWMLAQQSQNGVAVTEVEGTGVKWRSDQRLFREGWVQCSYEFDWTKKSEVMGAAWMVKNDRGMVLEHSKRAFVGVLSLNQAKLKVWLWVLESMRSLRKKKVVFVSTAEDIVEAIQRPTLWSSLQYEAEEIKNELKAFEAWELRIGGLEAVRSVSFIAQSVRSLGMMQSYVAADHPRWLDQLFANERNSSAG